MPIETPYIKSIAADFPGTSVNLAQLESEIEASTSGISIQLKDITRNGDVVTITFKDVLPGGEETALDSIVGAHTPSIEISTIEVDVSNTPVVRTRKMGAGVGRVWAISYNWCDRTTWYDQAVYVSEEVVGVGNGVLGLFSLDHGNVIDLSHGKVFEEDLIVAPSSSAWSPEITVDGVPQTERVPFASSGGDYSIDYETGDITFHTVPGLGDEIKASYYYNPDTTGNSLIELGPAPGKKWSIDRAEVQFSKDVGITDTIIWEIRAGGFLVSPATKYKTLGDYLDTSYGSFPEFPAMGGAARGLTQPTVLLRWEYVASIEILSSLGLKVAVYLENDIPFTGERATFTLYAAEEDE